MAIFPLSPRLGLAAAAAVLAAGCADDEGFPSLEPRAVETEDVLEEPVRIPAALASEPALRTRIAELLREARRGEAAFDTALGPASAAVRGAGPQGSDGWIEAQQAISRLEAARAPTTIALAELDRLAVERANRPTNEEDFAAIRSALDATERTVRSQQQRLDSLRSAVRR